jgi:hypothetical protein
LAKALRQRSRETPPIFTCAANRTPHESVGADLARAPAAFRHERLIQWIDNNVTKSLARPRERLHVSKVGDVQQHIIGQVEQRHVAQSRVDWS